MIESRFEMALTESLSKLDDSVRRIEFLESTNTMLADTVDAQRTVIHRQKARIVYLESVVAQLRKEGAA